MNKPAPSQQSKTSKTRVVVRELAPNADQHVRGGIVVTKVLDMATTG